MSNTVDLWSVPFTQARRARAGARRSGAAVPSSLLDTKRESCPAHCSSGNGAGNALDKIISFAHMTIHCFVGGIGVNLLVAPPPE